MQKAKENIKTLRYTLTVSRWGVLRDVELTVTFNKAFYFTNDRNPTEPFSRKISKVLPEHYFMNHLKTIAYVL